MCGTKGTLRAACIERYDAILRHVYYGLTSQMQNRVRDEGSTGNRTVVSGTDISPCVRTDSVTQADKGKRLLDLQASQTGGLGKHLRMSFTFSLLTPL